MVHKKEEGTTVSVAQPDFTPGLRVNGRGGFLRFLIHVLSEHLEKSHFPEFLAVKESHTTEIWSLECGWK